MNSGSADSVGFPGGLAHASKFEVICLKIGKPTVFMAFQCGCAVSCGVLRGHLTKSVTEEKSFKMFQGSRSHV